MKYLEVYGHVTFVDTNTNINSKCKWKWFNIREDYSHVYGIMCLRKHIVHAVMTQWVYNGYRAFYVPGPDGAQRVWVKED